MNKYIEAMKELNPDALKADGFDDCIVGIVDTFHGHVFLYDKQKVIESLMRDDMTEEDALEFFEFNIVGSYVSTFTPVYLEIVEDE
jgi:hypothetical protein